MPINTLGTMMGVIHGVNAFYNKQQLENSKLQAANTSYLANKKKEEVEDYTGSDWSQAPQGSRQALAYQKASEAYYGAINEKSLQQKRTELLKQHLKEPKGATDFTDLYMKLYINDLQKNAPGTIQKEAENSLKSNKEIAEEAMKRGGKI